MKRFSTNTPIEETSKIIEDRLKRDQTLKERTLLKVDDVMELLTFVLTTIYFQFRDQIYKQKFGIAMGSPVSPIAVNIFMEWLEEQAIHTAPVECKPRLWKWYVDDILEIVKKGSTERLTQVDPTESIKFAFEEEQDGKIPFLDTMFVIKPDNLVKLLVYRKKTHTDQYLIVILFSSSTTP